MKEARLSKLVKRRSERVVDFATPEAVMQLLRDYSERQNLPIFEMLRILAGEKVQSVSFTKDSPYFRFYARVDGGGSAMVKVNTGNEERQIAVDLFRVTDSFRP